MADPKPPAAPTKGAELSDIATSAASLEAAAAQVSAQLAGSPGAAGGDEEGRERARRQADPEGYQRREAEKRDIVQCRVLKRGDGRISRGRHYDGIGEDHYELGETFPAERVNAVQLEDKGYVEIMGEART
jgi:hypothetical protein